METTLTVELGPDTINAIADAIAARATTSTVVSSIETTVPVDLSGISNGGASVFLTLALFVLGVWTVITWRLSSTR